MVDIHGDGDKALKERALVPGEVEGESPGGQEYRRVHVPQLLEAREVARGVRLQVLLARAGCGAAVLAEEAQELGTRGGEGGGRRAGGGGAGNGVAPLPAR